MAVVEAHCRQAARQNGERKGAKKEKEKVEREREKDREPAGWRATRPDRPADLSRQCLPPHSGKTRARNHWLPTLAGVKRYSTVLLNARQEAATCTPLDRKIRA